MNKAKKLFDEIYPLFQAYKPKLEHINQMPERGVRDVLDKDNWGYYQFFAAYIKEKQPLQVVELGGAMGVGCVAMLSELHLDSHLYSITLEELGHEFSFIKKDYTNFTPVIGNDLDLTNWPKELDLNETDMWFFDSLHTREHLTKELELYSPFFKKGTVIFFDDIKLPELYPVWLDLKLDKYDVSVLHQPDGFGLAIK